jgi:hypothetical protein
LPLNTFFAFKFKCCIWGHAEKESSFVVLWISSSVYPLLHSSQTLFTHSLAVLVSADRASPLT